MKFKIAFLPHYLWIGGRQCFPWNTQKLCWVSNHTTTFQLFQNSWQRSAKTNSGWRTENSHWHRCNLQFYQFYLSFKYLRQGHILNEVKTKQKCGKKLGRRASIHHLVRLKWHSGTMGFSPQIGNGGGPGARPYLVFIISFSQTDWDDIKFDV